MVRKIMFAVDGSQTSDEMIDWALRELLMPGDVVELVHVHQRPSDLYALDSSLVEQYTAVENSVRRSSV